MKVSFTCMNTYYSAEAVKRNFTPTPRSLWDPELGTQTATWALEQARRADELGFDMLFGEKVLPRVQQLSAIPA